MRTTVSFEFTNREGTPSPAQTTTWDTREQANRVADRVAGVLLGRSGARRWNGTFNEANDLDDENAESLRWSLSHGDVNPILVWGDAKGTTITKLCQDTVTIHVYEALD